MSNWRQKAIYLADKVSGKGIMDKFNTFNKLACGSYDDLTGIQRQRLYSILNHCFDNIPYYREMLGDLKVIRDSDIDMGQFEKIPVLTKQIIREQKERLYSADYKNRKPYKNTSGGSTGEPVTFIQDKDYKNWGMAGRFYYNSFTGKMPGMREIKLWGSERDVFKGKESFKTRLNRWFFNVQVLNSFVMSDENMHEYVARWNEFKPVMVWAYASSIYELAKFADRNKLTLHATEGIICTAEPLTEPVREFVEKTIGTVVLNQYGSREIGIGGCECKEKQGLHIFPHLNYLEILNNDHNKVAAGEIGNFHFTTLTNYSMPLIRFEIGDTGSFSEVSQCKCGRSWPLLKSVNGRVTDHFKTSSGKIVHGEFFTHLFYGRDNVRQFQFVQEEINLINVFYVGNLSESEIEDIRSKMYKVMPEDCQISFIEKEKIDRVKSGKFRYTISKV